MPTSATEFVYMEDNHFILSPFASDQTSDDGILVNAEIPEEDEVNYDIEEDEVNCEIEEIESIGKRNPRKISRYFSVSSHSSSIRTFLTARSRRTVASTSSHRNELRTPWQQTLHEKNLIVSQFDETNWSGRGQHVEFAPSEDGLVDTMLIPKGVLGYSATALVEKVRCKRILLARKKIQCNWRVKREEMIEEVAHLQRLSHAHVVRGVGTYVIGRELCILLYPATSHNLETFLNEFAELNEQPRTSASLILLFPMKAALSRFFQCLINTVAFVHDNLIKHMDIKPTNLLVQEKSSGNHMEYKIYLADFGIARSYQAVVDVETDSPTSFSRIYAAPEVIRQDTRGFPADIFSLGCIFLEIEAALNNQMKEVIRIRELNPVGDLSYQANWLNIFSMPFWRAYTLDEISAENRSITLPGEARFSHRHIRSRYRDEIIAMLDENPAKRPIAAGLKWTFGLDEACCSMGPEPFEAVKSPQL